MFDESQIMHFIVALFFMLVMSARKELTFIILAFTMITVLGWMKEFYDNLHRTGFNLIDLAATYAGAGLGLKICYFIQPKFDSIEEDEEELN